MARTSAIGLRRDPQPPIPIVMPGAQLADDARRRLMTGSRGHRWPVARTPGGAASATPVRLSSKVKPCSNR